MATILVKQYVDEATLTPCDRCNGTGKEPSFKGKFAKCPECEGHGEYWSDYHLNRYMVHDVIEVIESDE